MLNSNDLKSIVQPVLDICNTLVPIMLLVVGAIGALWCILLGVKYAKADDPQEHEKAKKGLVNAIVGFVLIFVLLIMLNIGTSVLTNWWAEYHGI
jgi:cell division protein FtsW (lipid II flippase)